METFVILVVVGVLLGTLGSWMISNASVFIYKEVDEISGEDVPAKDRAFIMTFIGVAFTGLKVFLYVMTSVAILSWVPIIFYDT